MRVMWRRCETSEKMNADRDDTRKMLINTEIGNFNSEALRRTEMDINMDKMGVPENYGHQAFEKMISGKYLGEIVRLTVLDLNKKGEMFMDQELTNAWCVIIAI